MLRIQLLVCSLVIVWLSRPTAVVGASNVTVDISATGPTELKEGDIVSLTCTVSGPLDNSTDKIVLQKAGKEVTTLVEGQSGFVADPPENFELIPAEINSIGIFINGITRLDRGNYICKVLRRKNGNNYETVAEDSYRVNVHYTSDDIPSCDISPVNTIYTEEDMVTLKCTADLGYPPAQISWSASIQDDDINSALQTEKSVEEYNRTVLVLPVKITTKMDGIIFICVVQGSGDTTAASSQSCSIGPLEVMNKTGTSNTIHDAPSEDPKSVVNGGIIGGVVGVVVFLIIILIVVGLFMKYKSKESGQGNKTNKTRQISGPVANYNALSTVENGDDKPTESAGVELEEKTTSVLPSTNQKPESKTYPNPPSYPRPSKKAELTKTNPYANAQINSESEYATINPTAETNATQQRHENDEEVYDYPEQEVVHV